MQVSTPFVGGHAILSVPLNPSALGNPNAARTILQECLMRYHTELQGFLVAYANPRFSGSGDYGTAENRPLGRIVSQNPVIFARLESEVLLFRPVTGQVLEGCVNRVNAHSISCLVAGLFNATIMLDDVAGGYVYSSVGSGAFKSTEVWLKAREVQDAEGEEDGRGGGGGGGRSKRKRLESGCNDILAANSDTLEVGSTVFFKVKCILQSRGVMRLQGTFLP